MSPVLVAFARALGLAALAGAVTAGGADVTDHSAELGVYATLAAGAWRVAEGAYDRWVRGQAAQDGLKGGRPQDPSAYTFTGPGDLG